MKLAVIRTGGKQYLVAEGQILVVEKLAAEVGQRVPFETLLLVEDEKVQLSLPGVLRPEVEGEVLAQARGTKVRVFKYKPKVGYRRTLGHRQALTQVKILKIGA